MQDINLRNLTSSTSTSKALCIAFVLVLVCKLVLASVLDLYSDEIFYWQASALPALAYSDLPFITATLVGLGSALEPGNTLAVRLLFLIMGSSLPLLVYWLAKPITNMQQALESAALTLCLPLAGFLGLLAVPDVPLLFFGVLSIGYFERALRTNKPGYWVLTGLFVALGLSTHYRFFLYPVAAVAFLIFFKPEHKQWKNPLFWLAVCIALLGLIPILWFNLSNQLSSASFYFVDRHPWEFQAGGLLHVFKQAGLVTPPLYLVFAFTIVLLFKQTCSEDRASALLFCFAVVNISVYLVLAPWTDATSTSIHWPLSGYFPLLVFAPTTLRLFHQWILSRWKPSAAQMLSASIPIIGFMGTLVALIGVGSQAFQTQLQPILGKGVLSNKMAGWQEFTKHTKTLLDNEFSEGLPVIVTDNYYTAAQVGFAGLSAEALTLDNDKAVRDGRIAQYQIWHRDESGLTDVLGREMLFITEDSTLTVPDKHTIMGRVCSHTDRLDYIGDLKLFNGDKAFSFYKANSIIDTPDSGGFRSSPCPFPAQAWIDQPIEADELTGEVLVSGWAFNEDIGVESVFLTIDGERVGKVNYGVSRADVVEARKVNSDPNSPNLGFDYRFDSTAFNNGPHDLSISILNTIGVEAEYRSRKIIILN